MTRQQGRLGGLFKSPYRKSSSLRADDFGIFRKWSKGAASLLADCGGKGGRSSFGGHKQVQLGGRRAELVEEAFCLRIVETIFPCKLGNTVWAAADNFAGGCPIGVFYHVSNLLSVPHPIDSAKVELGKTLKVALPPLKAAFRRGSRNKKGRRFAPPSLFSSSQFGRMQPDTLLSPDQSPDENKNAGADEASDQIVQPYMERQRDAEGTEQPAGDERANNAEDDVHDDAGVALHDHLGEPASQTADDNCCNPTYVCVFHKRTS
ncbi:hypothetical protein J2W52_001518 [Rhizobium miluonense]|uniref:Uncharacterized protein n=1 Tax=Rhizobium miluonense TaxID=411945 RepID=A0ABU1SLS3_9HYPH|nr:hypothetical protein [Rhizobium miluonense]